MNLINKKLLQQKVNSYSFPVGEKEEKIKILIFKWQKALKDSDLENTKEKSIQGKFLQTFFEDILGYSDITSGEVAYSLIQHPRIENSPQEPDGSLGFFTKDTKDTRVVIELKDAKTNLDKKQNREVKQTPVDQAFNYASKEDKCKWVIVSNFKEIRLYSKFRSQEYYEKFLVSDLDNDFEFKKFYFLLTKENLIQKEDESIVEVLAKETNQQEQDITKDFYAKYKEVRLELLNHLIDNNPTISKEILIEKTQKLLDRFIFTLFCEDTTELLPYEIVKKTYERAVNSFSSSDQRVWQEFKGLFQAIDKGNARVTPPINAYNGGLFRTDDILDNLVILDELWGSLIQMASYDYQTELNVNILGHIFEQSISDLEKIKEEVLLSTEDGKIITTEDSVPISLGKKEGFKEKKGRRKKDGIFYTPEYITKYIVKETVGRYIEESPEKLQSIKILDPACGSGAFLNQAHSYLMQEYENRYKEKIEMKRAEGKEILNIFEDYNPADANRSILLNNLYGVDLNPESTEITKLGLWLKTATKTEPLQNLDKNIKCGNSLINDKSIAESKAFIWEEEFKEIFNEGGFDVVIANPPYVNIANIQDQRAREFLQKNYETVSNKSDLYSIFTEKAVSLLKDNGLIGLIFSNSWMGTQSFELFRKYLLEKLEILELVKLPDNVFPDATVKTVVLIARKKTVKNADIKLYECKNFVFDELPQVLSYSDIRATPSYTFTFDYRPNIKGDYKLSELVKFSLGIKTSNDKKFIIDYKKDENTHKMIRGRNIYRYGYQYDNEYIWYRPDLMKEKVGSGARNLEYFTKEKVLIQDIATQIVTCVDRDKLLTNDTISIIYDTGNLSCETLVALLNSKLINRWFKSTYPYGLHIKINQLETIPISKKIFKYQDELKKNEIQLEKFVKKKQELLLSVQSFLRDNYKINSSIEELSILYDLGWNNFEEKNRKIISKMEFKEKESFYSWYKEKASQILDISKTMANIEKSINYRVYEIYDLDDNAIKMIEEV